MITFFEKPVPYHSRNNQILPPEVSQVQKQLEELDQYTMENEMMINQIKSKVMLFNEAKKYDFTPTMKLNGETLEVVEEHKLLGVFITSDLKWNANTKYIIKKAYSRLWILRRLKTLGANRTELIDSYIKQVRSVLEYAAVVWHAGLTQINTADIERVQKSACAIILGTQYEGYKAALATLELERLSIRRKALCLKFAKKALKSDKYSGWFVSNTNPNHTRRKVKLLKDAQCRIKIFRKSALPYFTALLNLNRSDIL
jgi:hypothetical protein